jgi:hypothetical protein
MFLNSVSLLFVIVEVTTVGQFQLQFTIFEVTWQQASKHISKSIICGTVSMLQSECLVVSGEKERKERFGVPDQNPLGSGTVSTG